MVSKEELEIMEKIQMFIHDPNPLEGYYKKYPKPVKVSKIEKRNKMLQAKQRSVLPPIDPTTLEIYQSVNKNKLKLYNEFINHKCQGLVSKVKVRPGILSAEEYLAMFHPGNLGTMRVYKNKKKVLIKGEYKPSSYITHTYVRKFSGYQFLENIQDDFTKQHEYSTSFENPYTKQIVEKKRFFNILKIQFKYWVDFKYLECQVRFGQDQKIFKIKIF